MLMIMMTKQTKHLRCKNKQQNSCNKVFFKFCIMHVSKPRKRRRTVAMAQCCCQTQCNQNHQWQQNGNVNDHTHDTFFLQIWIIAVHLFDEKMTSVVGFHSFWCKWHFCTKNQCMHDITLSPECLWIFCFVSSRWRPNQSVKAVMINKN